MKQAIKGNQKNWNPSLIQSAVRHWELEHADISATAAQPGQIQSFVWIWLVKLFAPYLWALCERGVSIVVLQTRINLLVILLRRLYMISWCLTMDVIIYLSIYPIVLGTVGAPYDLATNIRHSSHSSALLTALLSSKPVQCRMLSSHRFLCLPLLLPPHTVPWRTVLALVTCPYHFILRLFTVDKSSS